MSALRVARAATGRKKILKFEGCYHGHLDSLLVKAGSGLAGVAAASSAGITPETALQTLALPLDNDEMLHELFVREGHDIAAVIIEPLPANYGLLIQRPEFLQNVAAVAKKYGTLLIFDEVISGFRVARGGMAQILDIVPDLVTYGKIIGGGFPVGCYGGRLDLMNLVAPLGPVYQAGTLSGNPIGMVAGLETLKKMERLDGWNVLNTRTEKFAKKLNDNFNQMNNGLIVDQFASLFWIRKNNLNSQPLRAIESISPEQAPLFKNLFLKCLDAGVYLAPNAYEVGFVSMAHSEEVFNETISIITKASETKMGLI